MEDSILKMEDSILNENKLKIAKSTTLEELHVLTVKLHQRIQFILVREKVLYTFLIDNSKKYALKMVWHTDRLRTFVLKIFLLPFYKEYSILNKSITIEIIYECFLYLFKDHRLSRMEGDRD